jgi:dihydrofolate synthase/folylpolyglutamate synthase
MIAGVNIADASKEQWLAHLESTHPADIEMGLGRVTKVAQTLNLFKPAPLVIVVGGTNGKGTTTALLAHLLAQQGLSSGSYNSPHIHQYNERINRRDSATEARLSTDDELCLAFTAIEQGRGDIPLTYFEFGTLAALWQIQQWQVDVALLEVGLGGRLDAVNIVTTDLAIVTSVGLDHQDWLGDTLDLIGMEKAGIGRKNKPLICGQLNAPQGFIDAAKGLQANTFYQGKDFSITPQDSGWCLVMGDDSLTLPHGHIPYFNIASAIAGLRTLNLLPNDDGIREAVNVTQVAGRLSHYPCIYNGQAITFILDVAHNAQAAEFLSGQVKSCKVAVLAMLADKDPAAVVAALPQIDCWQLAGLEGYRGQSSEALHDRVKASKCDKVLNCHDTVKHAMIASLQTLQDEAERTDTESKERGHNKILIIGSFLTVSAAEQALENIDGLIQVSK